MGSRPGEHRLVHPLARAPQFVGRETELGILSELWRGGTRGVVALVGLGGAGKTAVAARFIEQVSGGELEPRPTGLFVWSFYQEPDAGFFLEELHRYLSAAGPACATGERSWPDSPFEQLRSQRAARTFWFWMASSVCSVGRGTRRERSDSLKIRCSRAC